MCLGTAVLLGISTPVPALADPVTVVPDDGSRPEGGAPAGDQEPGEVPISGPGISRGPYADKIAEQTRSLADLGERTTDAEEQLKLRKDETSLSRLNWRDLDGEAKATEELAADMAAAAYQEKAAEIPGLTDKFEDLFEVNPELLNLNQNAIMEEAEDARSDAGVAKATLDAAEATEAIAEGEHKDLSKKLDKKTKSLEKLIERNREAITLEEQQAEANNERETGQISIDIDGAEAAEEAKQAVKFALKQTGKSYVWGDEGPNTYDCSGLTQTSYGQPGVRLPRIAKQQFRDTSQARVPMEKLLPGDLIFYGDVPEDWTSVYHVGMYIGDGQMVHAPRPGDVVRVAPVWFDEFVGAHRVVQAVDTKPAESKEKKDKKEKKRADSPSETPATKPESPPVPGSDEETTSGPGGGDAPTPTPTPWRG
ncbi:C40 family peptidase [Stackebrandtia nassauensis]|nr:C40 family peptidase [Stackebrandtia nassauensis]